MLTFIYRYPYIQNILKLIQLYTYVFVNSYLQITLYTKYTLKLILSNSNYIQKKYIYYSSYNCLSFVDYNMCPPFKKNVMYINQPECYG